MIDIAMSVLGNKFSFKSNLYFMRYMHANTKNETWTTKKNIIFYFFILVEFFYFLIKFSNIVCLDWSQKPYLFYKKKYQSLN